MWILTPPGIHERIFVADRAPVTVHHKNPQPPAAPATPPASAAWPQTPASHPAPATFAQQPPAASLQRRPAAP
ncbi:hypothetical protein GCM10010405_33970 [Streptomyces macrosporus]|uniref:Uncharacterized protein n=1 Tax=Streptomyces macrosporus TaxID=44032 RepID=A0ABN3K3F0_9ACTN